ncbi:MAG: hypothetical protein DRJ01_16590 [Bacteroidetes bacterium]|nr:MAG: hypothetical protein DRJ01_16590 [Bacteroidota bacterium]
MNIFIIVANPKKDSFSFAMADKYKMVAESKGNSVELLDLYRDEHQQSFFTYDDANNLPITPEKTYFQERIFWADELVFVFPYWWGSFPAILKNFFDWNLSRGFAFEYVNSRPKGLLMGKTVKVFSSSGAPSFIYKLTGANSRLKKMLQKQIVEFCGMKLTGFNLLGGVDTRANNTKEFLNKIK